MTPRTDKVDSLLTQEVANILARDFEPPEGCLVTVMHSKVTEDLKQAKIFISILPEKNTEVALRKLNCFSGHVQHILNRRLRMKFVPMISWGIDRTSAQYAAIDEALKAS